MVRNFSHAKTGKCASCHWLQILYSRFSYYSRDRDASYSVEKFALEKLQGNELHDIEIDSANDWPKIRVDSKEEWEKLKRDLVSAQQKIYEFLEQKNDEYLEEIVPGRDYDIAYLLRGIIQHDIYHLGQIGLIGSQLKLEENNHTGVFNLKE